MPVLLQGGKVLAGLCGLALYVPCMQVLQIGCDLYGCLNFMFCTCCKYDTAHDILHGWGSSAHDAYEGDIIF